MEHKRQRVQFGWLNLKARKNGPEAWVLRYRETLEDGRRKTRSVPIGTIKQYPSESLARKASMSFMLSINDRKLPELPVSFGALMQRYLAEELPERHSTASRYRCWLKNHIEPKWRDFPIPLYLTVMLTTGAEKALVKTLMCFCDNVCFCLSVKPVGISLASTR